MSKSAWGSAVDNLFNGETQVSFASLAQATLEDDLAKRRVDKFKISKLEVETPDNKKPIDLTTPSKPTTLERVKELKEKLSNGFSYSARDSFGTRFSVDATPRREDSHLHKAYGSYKGKAMVLEYEVS